MKKEIFLYLGSILVSFILLFGSSFIFTEVTFNLGEIIEAILMSVITGALFAFISNSLPNIIKNTKLKKKYKSIVSSLKIDIKEKPLQKKKMILDLYLSKISDFFLFYKIDDSFEKELSLYEKIKNVHIPTHYQERNTIETNTKQIISYIDEYLK